MGQPTDRDDGAATTAAPAVGPDTPRPVPGAPVAVLGRATQILLALQVPLLVALVVPTIHAVRRPDHDDRSGLTVRVAGASGTAVSGLGVAALALFVLTAAVWVAWLYRCRLNVETWGARLQTERRGWVVGGWFCPVVNLWMGYRVLSDILDDTEADPSDEHPHHQRRPLVLAWGAAWAVINAVQLVQVRNVWVAMCTIALTAVAAVLAIAVCRRLTRAQTARITATNPFFRP